uniref:Uncharacterized protein n=1 Tax=viral metagenome TaxID=1070528 RepID=A0A6C0BRD9_9ZZZZ
MNVTQRAELIFNTLTFARMKLLWQGAGFCVRTDETKRGLANKMAQSNDCLKYLGTLYL